MKSDFENIQLLYQSLKTEWERYKPVWDDISLFVGITVNPQYQWVNNQSQAAKPLDEYVDDPSSALCVNQAGDYLLGIMWGTGDNAFSLQPSRYVLELADEAELSSFYDYASKQALYHMNHEAAGLSTALRPYSYDQFSFGTSGVGAFPNTAFIERVEENALIFRMYGIDNTVIDEGKSGQVDIAFTIYHWKVNRIIGEFCMKNGEVDAGLVDKMPNPIKDAYRNSQFNTEFNIVFGFYPSESYDPKLKGKRGARYKGVWFMDDASQGTTFHEEYFRERPISIARAIKVRGERYGRASGTLLISTIRSTNFMVSTAIEIVDKMSSPSLGMFGNALMGDSVLDTSPNGLTIFQQAMAQAAGGKPIFPIHDVGDPSAILQFLVPYLNEKISTAFKVDALLDFSSAKEMTATESLQRYAIRGKSLAGFLLQQKNELLTPLTKRCVSLLLDMGELGVNAKTDAARAQLLRRNHRQERIIPDAVLQVMDDGRPWYEIKWNNELEKLTRTEAVQNLVQIIQAITAIAALYPPIIDAVDWYKLLVAINDNLDDNNQILIGEDEFAAMVAKAAQQRAAMMAVQAGQVGAQSAKDMAQANKSNKEAQVMNA